MLRMLVLVNHRLETVLASWHGLQLVMLKEKDRRCYEKFGNSAVPDLV